MAEIYTYLMGGFDERHGVGVLGLGQPFILCQKPHTMPTGLCFILHLVILVHFVCMFGEQNQFI